MTNRPAPSPSHPVTRDPTTSDGPSASGGRPALRCLVLEDDPDVARVLTFHLGRLGIGCTEVRTLRAATELLRTQEWDLAVVDVGLPDGDGRDLIAVIDRLRPRPAIVITSVLSTYDLADHAADAYLSKPFRKADIDRALRTAGILGEVP